MAAKYDRYSEEYILNDIREKINDKIDKFNDYQFEIITALLKGKDAFIVLPTGGGKSVCFQYPALVKDGFTVVIEPLIALMEDQVSKPKLKHKAKYIKDLNRDIPSTQAEREIFEKNIKLIYISPEKFLSPKFIRFAMTINISMIVIDEAHCVSLWGNGFRPKYLQIGMFLKQIGKRPQIAAFTATATKFVEEQVEKVLNMKKGEIFALDTDIDPESFYRRTNIDLSIREIPDDGYKEWKIEKFGTDKEFDMYKFLGKHKELKRLYFAYKTLFKKSSKYATLISPQYRTGNDEYDSIIANWLEKHERADELGARLASLAESEKSERSDIENELKKIYQTAEKSYVRELNRAYDEARKSLIGFKLNSKYSALTEDILSEENGAVIVYCSTRKNVEVLEKRLGKDPVIRKAGIKVCGYHGKMDRQNKDIAQKNFENAGSGSRVVMVATKAFGMGIDKGDVRLVIHFDVPRNPEDYFQEAGRAGRDRLPARAILYKYNPDIDDMNRFIVHGYVNDRNAPVAVNAEASVAEVMEESELTERAFLLKLELHRFQKMVEYMNVAPRSNENLSDYIANYFVHDRFGLNDGEISNANNRINKINSRPNFLYIATCKPAFEIRDGKYEVGKPYVCSDGKTEASFTLSERIDFFDLMLANAAYTLGFQGITSISAKKLFIMLTGDSNAAPEPKVRDEIVSRLVKMMNTDIEIRNPFGEPVRGKFLNLEQKTERIFTYRGTPPLCEYAIMDGCKFITIDANWLKVKKLCYENKKPVVKKAVNDNVGNILIKLYIAWRMAMLMPEYGTEKKKKYNSKIIRYEHEDKRRIGMLGIIGMSREDKPDLNETVGRILEQYKNLRVIKGYEFKEEKYGGESRVTGVYINTITIDDRKDLF